MTKFILGGLTLAAFIYALTLWLRRRACPAAANASGLKKRFLLATGLFLLFFCATGIRTYSDDTFDPSSVNMTELTNICGQKITSRTAFTNLLKTVWLRMNQEDTERVHVITDAAAKNGLIRHRVAALFSRAFDALSSHVEASEGMVRCYRAGPITALNQTACAAFLKQLELLKDLRWKLQIDEETSAKIYFALATQLELMRQYDDILATDDMERCQRLLEESKADTFFISDTAYETTNFVYDFIGLQKPEGASAERRLNRISKQVEHNLETAFLDSLGSIRDHLEYVKEKIFFKNIEMQRKVSSGRVRTCYLIVEPTPKLTPEQQQALSELQKKLLDEQVHAGVLPVEVAAVVRATVQPDGVDEQKATSGLPVTDLKKDSSPPVSPDETTIPEVFVTDLSEAGFDDASEQEIRAYQQEVRRIFRLLYQYGEIPPDQVRDMEAIIDTGIIHWNETKMLRETLRWYALDLGGKEVLAELVKRGIVDPEPVPSHRTELEAPFFTTAPEVDLDRFRANLDGARTFTLPGDDKVVIERYRIPQDNPGVRLQCRHVLRSLFDASRMPYAQIQKTLDRNIGIPLVGTIDKPETH